MVGTTNRVKELTAAGLVIITVFLTGIAGSGEIKLEDAYGNNAVCEGGFCYFDANVSNNYAEAITIYPDYMSASDKRYNNHITSSDAFKREIVKVNISATKIEEKSFKCPYKASQSVLGEIGNQTNKYVCENPLSKEKLFDKDYTSFDSKTDTFKYLEASQVNETIDRERKSKEAIVLGVGETVTVRVYFTAPINTAGKFDVDLDVYVDGKKHSLILDPWYSTEIPYKQEIKIYQNEGFTETDWQVKLEIDNTTVAGEHFNWTNNGDDIRFTNSTENGLLDYYIEDWDSTAETATIWVEVTNIPSGVNTSIYMYYGNISYSAASNGVATFIVFEDCEDISEWTATNDAWTSYGSVGSKTCRSASAGDDWNAIYQELGIIVGINTTMSFYYDQIDVYGTTRSPFAAGFTDVPLPSVSTNPTIGINESQIRADIGVDDLNAVVRYLGVADVTVKSGTFTDNQYKSQIINNTHLLFYEGGTIKAANTAVANIVAGNFHYAYLGLRRTQADFDNITVYREIEGGFTFYFGEEQTPGTPTHITVVTWTDGYNESVVPTPPTTSHTFNWTTDYGATTCNLTFGGTWYNQTNTTANQTDWYKTITLTTYANTTDINITCGDISDSVTSDNAWLFYAPAECDYVLDACKTSGWVADSTYCVINNITAGDVCFDNIATGDIVEIGGYVINGSGTSNGAVVINVNDVTIRNGTFCEFGGATSDGVIQLEDSNSNKLIDITVHSADSAIESTPAIKIINSSSNICNNVTLYDNEGQAFALVGSGTVQNNLFYNIQAYDNVLKEFDPTTGTVTNTTLIYNNTYGQIRFLDDINFAIEGTLRFGTGQNIDIASNYVFLNSSSDISELNISANITLYSTGITNPIILKNGVECTDCTLLSSDVDNHIFNVTSWSNYTLEGAVPDTNFSIWTGSAWENAYNYYMDFRCFATQQDCEPDNQDAGGSQAIYQICNNGTATADFVQLWISETCANIGLYCDDDYTVADAILINTDHNTIHETLNIDECTYISCWADYNNPTQGCFFETEANVTN